MCRKRVAGICLAVFHAVVMVPVLAGADVALLPQPQSIKLNHGSYVLTTNTALVGTLPEVQLLAETLRRASGLPLPIMREGDGIRLRLDPSLKEQLGLEGYRCRVTEKEVEITAADGAGLFYGGITFRQLLPEAAFETNASSNTLVLSVPCVEIVDQPERAWRGLMFDVARHYVSPDILKKWIDVMAVHKLNRLHLHLTDDQAWRVPVRQFPRLVEIGAVRAESPKKGDRLHGDGISYGPYYYTREQILDLVAYAKSRHVMIIPEVDFPGHCVAALAAYPEFSCRGVPLSVSTEWKRKPDVLCVGNEDAVAFVASVLEEVGELFSTPYIHIGGDEVILNRWKECPKCQARMKSLGFQDESQLQAWFTHKLEDSLASHHRCLLGWDEILEGNPSSSTVLMAWRDSDSITAAVQAGHTVVAVPQTFCYFDSAQSRNSGEPESNGRFLPLAKVYNWNLIPENLPENLHSRVIGAEGMLWSEYLFEPSDVEYAAFPRACALAEVVWTRAECRNETDFMRRLSRHLERLKSMRVNYRPLQ